MIEIIAGTDRPRSRTLQVARIIQSIYQTQKIAAELLSLESLPLVHLHGAGYKADQIKDMETAVARINKADGLVVVIPEYNGSFPGSLKHFVDYWKFPDSFEGRPVAFVGLGGRFGGLRAVEHMQQVFGYRNAFIFPNRVFLIDVQNLIKDEQLIDSTVADLLNVQTRDFTKFIKALKSAGLDANSITRA